MRRLGVGHPAALDARPLEYEDHVIRFLVAIVR